jgi:hypothetical protein
MLKFTCIYAFEYKYNYLLKMQKTTSNEPVRDRKQNLSYQQKKRGKARVFGIIKISGLKIVEKTKAKNTLF